VQRTLAETLHTLTEKKQTLLQIPEESIRTLSHSLKNMEALHEREVAHVTSCMDYAIQFLLIELESVGNIRFEEGSSTDPFSSCCDLLHLRFSHSNYRAYDVTGIKINKVIRIHNTALRLRFEEKLQMLLSDESSCLTNYRRRLEHLFYVPNPGIVPEKEDLLHILENGFKTAEQFKFLGNSTPIKNGEFVEKNNYPTAHSVYLNIITKNKTTSEVPSSPRVHGSESCRQHRKWFIFDNELILPEYIIYFEYVTMNQEKANHMYNTEKNGTSPSEITVDREVLNMEPVLKPQPKLLILDDKMLLNVTQANVFSQITQVLNLHGNSLSKLKDICRITTLRHLCISFNEFTQLDDIRGMHSLEFLDASFNRLVTLEGMRSLPKLKDLDVRWNKLTRAREDMTVLMKHTPALLRLDTRHNPWKRVKSVQKIILAGLKSLTHLDDELITEEEATEAVGAAETRITQHSSTNAERPRSLSLLSTAHFLCGLSHHMWNMS
uniref:Uncharacterized protein n=1 Tax=Periophthalmus magnuspinnatus TaxID=409849 RepID=A0A3B3ZSQ7_9GOBI